MTPSPRPHPALRPYRRRTLEELHRDTGVAAGRLRALRRVLSAGDGDAGARFPHVWAALRAERQRLEAELADLAGEHALRPEERRS
jgi:hypothetical protein